MILAVDIGGTKTLVAICKQDGLVVDQVRFETPKKYKDFLNTFSATLETIDAKNATIVSMAVPAKIDRKTGMAIAFGNLSWKNVPIKTDIEKLTGKNVLIENDANLAGLSEIHNLNPLPHKGLYITISTGIGTGIISNGYLDEDFVDSEGGQMLFEHDNKLQKWEEFASGKAIVAKYGKRASEITDKKIWSEIANNFAIGIVNLCSVLDPDVIVIGGGVGSHFKKFEQPLSKRITQIISPLIKVPKILPAKHAEEAVILGCVIYAKQRTKH
jgi:predicted NBD/HSP70 family sugar kinase